MGAPFPRARPTAKWMLHRSVVTMEATDRRCRTPPRHPVPHEVSEGMAARPLHSPDTKLSVGVVTMPMIRKMLLVTGGVIATAMALGCAGSPEETTGCDEGAKCDDGVDGVWSRRIMHCQAWIGSAASSNWKAVCSSRTTRHCLPATRKRLQGDCVQTGGVGRKLSAATRDLHSSACRIRRIWLRYAVSNDNAGCEGGPASVKLVWCRNWNDVIGRGTSRDRGDRGSGGRPAIRG